MNIIEGNALAKLCDYSFGSHHRAWDQNVTGEYKEANAQNDEFLAQAREFEGRVMTLFIDNIRLYPRSIKADRPEDANLHDYLFRTNNLLALCSLLPNNSFIIFTSHEDTPIDDKIQLPFNVLKIYAINALYNTERIIPFPMGLQRQIGKNDHRLEIMQNLVESTVSESAQPSKLLYINCGIGRNPERLPLAKFETNDWCTTRFDRDSKFYPYERYHEFLSELRDHKFVICPKGHGYDTHRIWETLYMRRMPIMLRDPYFERLLKDFPVAFVDSWEQMTKERLTSEYADDFYQAAQAMDLSKLDLKLLFKQAVTI